MSKRAKYTGPHVEVGVEIGENNVVVVERDHLLPNEDARGEPIPASIRDELLERADWSEVDQSTAKKKED